MTKDKFIEEKLQNISPSCANCNESDCEGNKQQYIDISQALTAAFEEGERAERVKMLVIMRNGAVDAQREIGEKHLAALLEYLSKEPTT